MKLVLCLTNTVAANFTANVLLAIGEKPAMLEDPSEAAELARVADATLVNVGTLHPRQAEAMRAAVAGCAAAKRPWALDPVAVHLLGYRRTFVEELVRGDVPTLIRGNHAEIDFLRSDGRIACRPVMLSTGEIDRIYSADGVKEIRGGVRMLELVTATGCAQGAVAAAMLARGMSPSEAAEAASVLMKRAGERAFERAKAPGGFRAALVDALYDDPLGGGFRC